MTVREFPKDFFVPISGEEHKLGRLCLNRTSKGFHIEVDIVFSETKKILKHIDILYFGLDFEKDEVIQRGIQRLATFLKSRR